MPKSGYKIAVLGLWHLGETYAAGLAELGHKVVGFDYDSKTVSDLSRGVPPLKEPGLEDLVKKNLRARRLSFSHDIKIARNCDAIWITIDTPVDERDVSDVKPIMKMIRGVAPHMKSGVTLIVSSQIPAGTSKEIQDLVKKSQPKLKFHYVYSPENLRLGEALKCFFHPERIIVGASDQEGTVFVKKIFAKLKAEIVLMSPASAEMAKHALNAFLATSISFINDIADECEKVGADVLDVANALRSDPRIGARAALGAGMGFSGGTLGRDLVSLLRLAKRDRVSTPVIGSVFLKNASRPTMLVRRLESLLGSLKKARIAIFGLTYKPGTSTLRRSRSLEIASMLRKRGAAITLYDPHVAIDGIPSEMKALVARDLRAAVARVRAIVFLTPWSDFKGLNFRSIAKSAGKNAIVFDATNFLHDKEDLIKMSGFRYHGVGR